MEVGDKTVASVQNLIMIINFVLFNKVSKRQRKYFKITSSQRPKLTVHFLKKKTKTFIIVKRFTALTILYYVVINKE